MFNVYGCFMVFEYVFRFLNPFELPDWWWFSLPSAPATDSLGQCPSAPCPGSDHSRFLGRDVRQRCEVLQVGSWGNIGNRAWSCWIGPWKTGNPCGDGKHWKTMNWWTCGFYEKPRLSSVVTCCHLLWSPGCAHLLWWESLSCNDWAASGKDNELGSWSVAKHHCFIFQECWHMLTYPLVN